jgi:hypothetical protein
MEHSGYCEETTADITHVAPTHILYPSVSNIMTLSIFMGDVLCSGILLCFKLSYCRINWILPSYIPVIEHPGLSRGTSHEYSAYSPVLRVDCYKFPHHGQLQSTSRKEKASFCNGTPHRMGIISQLSS